MDQDDDTDLGLGAVIAPRPFHTYTPRPSLPEDPAANIGWPTNLPLEIALQDATPKEICASYGIGKPEWDIIRQNPHFVSAVGRALDELRVDGMGFKARARMQATEMLKENWVLVHDRTIPAAVRADLIKNTIKVAGLDASKDAALVGAKSGAALQINIQLG